MKNYKLNFKKTFAGMLFVLFAGYAVAFAASDYNRNINLLENEVKKDVEGTIINNAAVLKEYGSVSNLKKAGCTCSDKCVCRRKCKSGACYVRKDVFFINGNEAGCDIPKTNEEGVAYDNYDKIYHITGDGEKRYRCKMVKEFDVSGNELQEYREKKKAKKKLAYNVK